MDIGTSRRAVEQAIRLAEVVIPSEPVSEIAADPADDRVLEAAAEGSARVIVSGDGHLLELGTWRGIAIKSPSGFIADLAAR